MRIYELNLKRSRGAQNLYLTDVNLGLSNAQVVYSPKDKACETVTRELIRVMNGSDDSTYDEMMGALEAVVNAFIVRDGEVYVENETAPDFRVMELKGDEVAVMDGANRVDGRDADELGIGRDTWGFEYCKVVSQEELVRGINDEFEEELAERGVVLKSFEDLEANLATVEGVTGDEYVWEQ